MKARTPKHIKEPARLPAKDGKRHKPAGSKRGGGREEPAAKRSAQHGKKKRRAADPTATEATK